MKNNQNMDSQEKDQVYIEHGDTPTPSGPDEPNPERFSLAKNFQVGKIPQEGEFDAGYDYLAVDNYVDAKDQVNNWCAAQVLNVDHEQRTVLLHFEGWSNRYDQTFKRTSMRIAPFRAYSVGYTGQQKIAYRDFKINPAYMAIMTKKVQDVLQSNFQNFERPYAVTQFLRGEFFYYVDSLLTMTVGTNEPDLPEIVKFMDLAFQLINGWLNKLADYVPAYHEAVQSAFLFCVDMQAAQAMCASELGQLIGKIFGLCKRAKTLFNKFRSEYLVPGEYARADRVEETGFNCSLVNLFGKLDGFKVLLQLSSNNDIPLPLLTSILSKVKYMHFYVQPNIAQEFSKTVINCLTFRLDNIQPRELKDLNKESIQRAVSCLEHFQKICSTQDTQLAPNQLSELYELKIAKQQLCSPFFERRIRGITEFKDIFRKVRNANMYNKQQLDQKEIPYSKYLTFEIYSQWLHDEKVLEYIFLESPHAELIKRSLELSYLRAVDQLNPLSNDLLEGIWRCCTEKHEAIAGATFVILQDLSQHMPLSMIEFFFNKIKQLQDEDYDDVRITFLKKFTLGTLVGLQKYVTNLQEQQRSGQNNQAKNNNKRGQSKSAQDVAKNIDAALYLDLSIFWRIGQEASNQNINNGVQQKTKDLALQYLVEILTQSHPQLTNLCTKNDFIKMVLINLRQGQSVHTSLLFLKKLLLTYPLDSINLVQQRGQPPIQTREKTVYNLREEKIYDLIIQNAVVYIKEYQKQQNDQSGAQSQANSKFYTHQEHIDAILSTLEFLIVNSKTGGLDANQVAALFECFVQSAATPYERQQFFVFMTKENEQSQTRDRKYLIDEQCRQMLFSDIMCNPAALNPRKLGAAGFLCFKLLFLNVNSQARNLDVDQKGNFSTNKLLQLQGFDSLWQVAILAEEESVNTEARNFLVDLYLKAKISDKQKKDLTEAFLNKLDQVYAQLLQQDDQKGNMEAQANDTCDQIWPQNWLMVLATYIRRYDWEHIPELSLSKFDANNNIEVQVTLTPNNVTHTVVVNSGMRIWQLIIQIAKAFGMRRGDFRIVTGGGPLDQSIYSDPISQYVISQIKIKRLDEKQLDKENPRRLIAQNKPFITNLIKLMQTRYTTPSQTGLIKETVNLLEDMPVNATHKAAMVADISKLKNLDKSKSSEISGVTPWLDLFQQNSLKSMAPGSLEVVTPQTCYNLIVLQDLLTDSTETLNYILTPERRQQEQKQQLEFKQAFVNKGGLNFLVTYFIVLNKQQIFNSTIRLKVLQILLKILPQFFFQQDIERTEAWINWDMRKNFFEQNLAALQNYVLNLVQDSSEHKQEENLKTLQAMLALIQRLIVVNWPVLLRQLYDFPDIATTFLQIFTQLDNPQIQSLVSSTLQEICRSVDLSCLEKAGYDGISQFQVQVQALPSCFILKLFLERFLPETLRTKKFKTTQEIFRLANFLLLETEVSQLLHIIRPIEQLVPELVLMIKQRPISESFATQQSITQHAASAAAIKIISSEGGNKEDYVLQGLFNFLTNVLQLRADSNQFFNLQQRTELAKYLMNECLFEKNNSTMGNSSGNQEQAGTNLFQPPKCKTMETRNACLQLLKQVTINNPEAVKEVVCYLRDRVLFGNVSWYWRSARRVDWTITAEKEPERAACGYVGLKNIGCICYMNSILQQLYMVPNFRKAMLEVHDSNSASIPKEENCLYQLKRIFSGLSLLEKQYYNPKKFCAAFKDIDGSPIDPRVQKDVDEFFNMLIDRIESLIKGTKEEQVMKNLFYGCFANELICHGCPHTSEREEVFMAVQLQVQNKHSIKESLSTFVQGEMLEGDNAYYCEQCECKRDTLKRCTIKRLPNVLFLELKRFEFNFDTMSKFKVNDYCEFPHELDMEPYSTEAIQRQDLLAEMEEKSLSVDDLTEDQLVLYNKVTHKDYFRYKLQGVVVHVGTADSGHYYSFINDREHPGNGWFEFNDQFVNPFDPDHIPDECFGGDDPDYEARLQRHQNDAAMRQILIQQGKAKLKNAYILIYERVQFIDQAKFVEIADDRAITVKRQNGQQFYQSQLQTKLKECMLPMTRQSQIQMPPAIQEEILEKNRRYWTIKYMFNKPIFENLFDVFNQWTPKPVLDYKSITQSGGEEASGDLEKQKFLVTFLLTVCVRAQSRFQLPNYVKLIKSFLQKSVPLSAWLLQMFSCQQMIKEFFMDCPVVDMSRFVAGMLRSAMQTLYKFEEPIILNYLDQVKLNQFVQNSQSQTIIEERLRVRESNQQEDPPVSTQYNKVTVFTLSKVQHPLPIMVVMINSFLHLQGSSYQIKNQYMTQQFQHVICAFASLGKTARLYLLKTGCLIRFIQQFITHQFQELDQNLRLPLFILQQSETDANKQLISRNMLEGIEKKKSQKERPIVNQREMAPYFFLLRSISYLVRDSLLEYPADNKIQQDQYYMSREEIELLANEFTARNWWKSSSVRESTIGRNAVSQIFTHLCTANFEFSQTYVKEIFTQMGQGEFTDIRFMERFVLDFCTIKDQYQEDRITRVLNQLHDSLRKNSQYWKVCDSFIELTIKLCIRCQPFVTALKQNKNLFSMIEQIVKENPSFPYGSTQKKLFKTAQVNWAHLSQLDKGLVNQKKVEQVGAYRKQRFELLSQIVTQNRQPDQVDSDSDNDCYDLDLKEGDLVDAKFFKGNMVGWFPAEVILALEEMMRVRVVKNAGQTSQPFDSNTATWIEKESNRLAKIGTYTKNEKNVNHQYFVDILKLVEPPVGSQGQGQNNNGSNSGGNNNGGQNNNQNIQNQNHGRSGQIR